VILDTAEARRSHELRHAKDLLRGKHDDAWIALVVLQVESENLTDVMNVHCGDEPSIVGILAPDAELRFASIHERCPGYLRAR
jgi:hypothetical protein